MNQLTTRQTFATLPGCLSIAPMIVLAIVCGGKPVWGQETKASKWFDERVAPILVSRCFECHDANSREGNLNLTSRSAARKGGDTGSPIKPGDLDASLLWQRVRDEEMPPEHPLSLAEKNVLRTWIAAGAEWGSDPIDRFRYSSGGRAGYDWWSLQPLKLLDPPADSFDGWSRNAIDRYIGKKLHDADLTPSPEADRRILIRRLSFDLLGLPPTPDEIAAFVSDNRPDAYARLVDRMLASPRYGIRWGRHWLDLARFGESQGFERDKLRENAWPYRDWVIRALNEDLSYREFARNQLAGDVLRAGDASATIATGFLVAGPWDEVGNSQQSAAMRAVVRQDELEDLVSLIGQTFLGLTVNCARCHDHKFDPIRQTEYYQLTAALSGVRHGQRDVVRPHDQQQARDVESQLTALRTEIAAMDKAAWASAIEKAKMRSPKALEPPPQPMASWDFSQSLEDTIGSLDGKFVGGARLDSGALLVDGTQSYVETAPLDRNLTAKTLEAWVKLDDLGQRGGAAISLQTIGGAQFDAIVYGEREPNRWMAGSDGFRRTQSFSGPEETEAKDRVIHFAVVYHADGRIEGYRDGRPYGKAYASNGPQPFAKGKAQLVFGLRHSPPGGNRMLRGGVSAARLYDRALNSKEVMASFQAAGISITPEQLRAAMTESQRQRRDELQERLQGLVHMRRQLRPMSVYLPTPRKPDPAFVLRRGNPTLRGDPVKPAGVAALRGVDADFALDESATDAQRRIKLAEWISDPENPLFARVIANRVWHYHFGSGLVNTPSDFGFNGGHPSHRELLDYLALDLRDSGWSLKRLHRRIVCSATYRQSSRFREDAAAVDAANRLLWRMTPRRLAAEEIRDAMLAIAGTLNEQMGGPGFRDFTTFVHNTQFYEMKDPIGAEFNRRSIYRTWVRSGRNRFLDAFDCPDPSTKTPKRALTLTPLQALSLMNHSFSLRTADQIAERIGRQGDKRIERMFYLLFGRAPEAGELASAARFAEQHGDAALARVLLNSNEFVFVD